MSALLTASDLTKSFGARRVLDQVSLAIHEGDRIGLIGRNGSGKSTLMKLITGGLEPDDGRIVTRRDLTVEYVAQEPRLDLADTVATALARPGVPDHEVHTMAAGLALPPLDAVVGQLSLGERRRVALGRALLGRAELLALDEPTNHLDARTVEWLETRLARRPGALLLVTHDRAFLDQVVTRILELDRRSLYAYDGDYSEFVVRQAERLAGEAVHERARAQFVRRELDWIRRRPKARTTKAQARIDRFDAAVAATPTADDRLAGAITLRLPDGGRLGRTILELHGLGRRTPERPLFTDLTLALKPGDRIGIVGPNGAGKTTLIRTILGLDPPDSGRIELGVNTRCAYLEQGRTELDDARTVLEEVADGEDQVAVAGGTVHVRTFLRALHFDDSAASTRIADLSGGERNRVQLARLLRRGGNLLVLDEPTNDLDLLTLGALEDALCEFGGCALIVSHDRWFLDRVATAILAFEPEVAPGRVVLHQGDYTSYAARRAAAAEARAAAEVRATPSATPTAPRRTRPTPAGPRKLNFNERRELDAMEETIGRAEDQVAELEATLSDPALFKDRPTDVPALVAQLDAARAEVDRLYNRWSELEQRAELDR